MKRIEIATILGGVMLAITAMPDSAPIAPPTPTDQPVLVANAGMHIAPLRAGSFQLALAAVGKDIT
jgi:hypothetical protein